MSSASSLRLISPSVSRTSSQRMQVDTLIHAGGQPGQADDRLPFFVGVKDEQQRERCFRVKGEAVQTPLAKLASSPGPPDHIAAIDRSGERILERSAASGRRRFYNHLQKPLRSGNVRLGHHQPAKRGAALLSRSDGFAHPLAFAAVSTRPQGAQCISHRRARTAVQARPTPSQNRAAASERPGRSKSSARLYGDFGASNIDSPGRTTPISEQRAAPG